MWFLRMCWIMMKLKKSLKIEENVDREKLVYKTNEYT